MVVEATLQLSFWAEEVNTTCYNKNGSVIVQRHRKTSYEMLKWRKPCYILNQKDQHWKFKTKADERFFLGYSNEFNADKVLNIISHITEESIYVMFDDDSDINDPINHLTFILEDITHCPSSDYELTKPFIMMLISPHQHPTSLKILSHQRNCG